MITIEDNKVFILLGTGDVAMCQCKTEEEFPRNFVVLLQTKKGETGNSSDIDRKFPIKKGWVFKEETDNVIGIEATNKESLDVLIDTLVEYRDEIFGTQTDDYIDPKTWPDLMKTIKDSDEIKEDPSDDPDPLF